MSLVLGLGLEHFCPWPQKVLSSERLFLALASDFFCALGLDLEPCVLDSTSGFGNEKVIPNYCRYYNSGLFYHKDSMYWRFQPLGHSSTYVYIEKINYQHHLINFVITSFWRFCPKPSDIATPKMQCSTSCIDLSCVQISSF